MSGFGSGSLFGQQANAQGTSAFGSQPQVPANNSFGFGSKRAQSFDSASPSAPKSFGFSGAAQNPSPFGQSNTPQNTGSGSGSFGNSGQAPAQNNSGGSLFGNNSKPAANTGTGGLFGNSTNTGSSSGSGLFGNDSTSKAPGGFSFGNTSNTAATGASFGLGAPSAKPLFGSAAAPNNNASATPGSGFGTTSTNNASGGGLFGNTVSSTQPGGAFGGSTLGGSTLGGSTLGGSTLGGSTLGASTLGGSTLGGSTLGGGSLGGSAFGGSALGGNSLGNSGGLFGKPPAASLFGQGQQGSQQQLQTGVDQASYVLSGVSPSQKLYSSLSMQSSKRDHAESESLNYESKAPVARSKFALPNHRTSFTKASHHKALSGSSGAPLSGSLKTNEALISSDNLVTTTTSQGEPRKWINSYEKFVRERPTTLIIKRQDRKLASTLLIAPESAPVAAEPPAIASSLPGNSSVSLNPAVEKSFRDDLDEGITNEPDVSMFHRQANNMTLVRVNRQAIEEGYYISPRLEDLAAMSKQQLLQVEHLVIGREGFGKIEYPGAVNLSRVSNLGDILGVLVIFGPGTVCVYPNEGSKAAPGNELNMPCVVSIENAWPRDSSTQKIIKDVDDPRMLKHIQRLRKACESRGGEFVTFTQGIWVFKVPHFSTWGLPTSEMVIGEDDLEESDSFSQALNPEPKLAPRSDEVVDEDMPDNEAAPQLTSSPLVVDAGTGQFDEQLTDTAPEMDAEEFKETHDATMTESDLPQTWQDQLIHASNGVLLAASGSLVAASEPTSKLDLEDILDPLWKKSGRQNMEKAVEARHIADPSRSRTFNAKTNSSKLSSLRESIKIAPRQNSNLPYLHTAIHFQDVGNLLDSRRPLWKLLSILHDNSKSPEEIDTNKLSTWLDESVRHLSQDPQGTALEKIWQLVSCHDLHAAYNLAVKSNNIHLSLLLSLLGQPASKKSLKSDAENQLNDWATSYALNSIPLSVLRIWEVAAGKVPSSARFDWKQWLGLQFWYCEEQSVQRAIQSLPRTYAAVKDLELTFLECFAGKKQLRTAVNELDNMQAFLCLQAMLTNNPSAVKADLKCLDNVCTKLAEQFDQAGDAVNAVYIGLHISDTKLSAKIIRSILQKSSLNISLPSYLGVPEEFLNESRANQVARQGEFTAQAEYLLRAGLFNDAHKVIISEAAPEAVLNENMSQLLDVLESLEKVKDKLKRWDFGGNVYLTYARALSQAPDQYTVVSMCNALRYIDTPTLKSEKAVSQIAKWVASTSVAKSTLASRLILGMKFDTSQLRVQTLQEASRLLQ